MPDEASYLEIRTELERLMREIEAAGELTEAEVVYGKRKLPRILLGKDVYAYDKERKILRNIRTRETRPLTAEDIRHLDWFVETMGKLREELKEAQKLHRAIASRERHFEEIETGRKVRARRALREIT